MTDVCLSFPSPLNSVKRFLKQRGLRQLDSCDQGLVFPQSTRQKKVVQNGKITNVSAGRYEKTEKPN